MSTNARSAGTLYVVGTPIGNLAEGSPAMRAAFEAADAVLCEDTRVTGRLLAAWGISKPLERADAKRLPERVEGLVARLLQGETLALASDAGMPAISDPGQLLVDAALEAGVRVEVVAGPSALTAAVAASGLSCARFTFLGFLVRKGRARVEELALVATPGVGAVIYESPHRVAATLADLARVAPGRRVALCRELTKLHQEVLRGSAGELVEVLRAREGERGALKGECVLVVEAAAPRECAREAPNAADLARRAAELLDEGLPASKAAKALAKELGVSRDEAYARVLALKERASGVREGE